MANVFTPDNTKPTPPALGNTGEVGGNGSAPITLLAQCSQASSCGSNEGSGCTAGGGTAGACRQQPGSEPLSQPELSHRGCCRTNREYALISDTYAGVRCQHPTRIAASSMLSIALVDSNRPSPLA